MYQVLLSKQAIKDLEKLTELKARFLLRKKSIAALILINEYIILFLLFYFRLARVILA